MSARIELVRQMFAAFTEGGVDAVLEVVPADVVWAPSTAGGRRFTSEEVTAYLRDQASDGVEQRQEILAVEEHGDCVLVHGSLRVSTEGGHVDEQLFWLYRFDGDRLREALSFPTRHAALEATSERGSDTPAKSESPPRRVGPAGDAGHGPSAPGTGREGSSRRSA